MMVVNVKAPGPGSPSAPPAEPAAAAPAPVAATSSSAVPAANSSSTTSAPVSIRITPSGKLYTYVRHALDSLTEHPEQQVEIHTRLAFNSSLPPIKVPSSTIAVNTSTSTIRDPTHTGLLPCTTSIPRLFTVLEIIKREYLRLQAGRGKGLWQYNKFGGYSGKEVHDWEEQQNGRKVVALPVRSKGKGKAGKGKYQGTMNSKMVNGVENAERMDVDTVTSTDGGVIPVVEQVPPPATTTMTEAETIATTTADVTVPTVDPPPITTSTNHADKILTDILTGGPNHIKMRHTPYMSVILSTRPLPHLLSDPEISYQPVKPLGRRKARRARRKGQTTTVTTDGAETQEEEDAGPAKKARRASGVMERRGGKNDTPGSRGGRDEAEEEEEGEEVEEVEVVEGSSDDYDDQEEGETMEVEEE